MKPLPLLLAGLCLLAFASTSLAQDLQYKWQEGSQFAYSFQVTATVDREDWQLDGKRVYTTKAFQGARQSSGEEVQGSGTGFLVSADGHLVTCAHVVEGARKIQVHLDGATYDATVIETDKAHDIALLKINANNLPVLPLSENNSVELAQDVRAFGFPLSDVLGASIKITRGTVAGFVEKEDSKLIQVDAAINPGNSGGPVVNDRGEVIGVASAKLTGRNVSNVGFVVPINQVHSLLQRKSVGFTSSENKQAFTGPELARQVVPAVAYITVSSVTTDSGGERFRIALEGSMSTTRAGNKQAESEPLDDGSLVASIYGQVGDVGSTAQLPFYLGSLDMLLIETFAPDQQQWVVEDNSPVAEFREVERRPVPGQKERLPLFVDTTAAPKDTIKVMHPAVALTAYEIIGTTGNMIEIKKTYKMATKPKFGRSYAQMSGEGTLKFDTNAGVPHSLHYKGTLTLLVNNLPQEIPVTFKYERINPSAAMASVEQTDRPRFLRRPHAERSPVPNASELAEAKEVIAEVYGGEIKQARTDSANKQLAEKFLTAALDPKEVATLRYALFEMANETAAESDDLDLAMRVVDEFAWSFQINGWKSKYQALQGFANRAKTRVQHEAVALAGTELVKVAVELDEYAIARVFGQVTLTAARSSGNDQLVAAVMTQGREMVALEAAHKSVAPALDTLRANAADPTANQQAGEFYCYWKNNWNKGLPLLAKGGNDTLRPLADLELSNPDDARSQNDIADGWWDIAEAIEPQGNLAQLNVQQHAARWYRKAAPGLSALSKAKAEKRVASVDLPGEAGQSIVPTSDGRPSKELSDTEKLLASIKESLAAKKGSRTSTVGFTLGKQSFAAIPEQGSLVVGFNLSQGGGGVNALSPLYITEKGYVTGPAIGRPNGQILRVVAKKGYAVGAVAVAGGLGIDGMAIRFMKITATGLDTTDTYDTNWIGNAAKGPGKPLGGDGSPVIGIYGHYDSSKISSLGLALGEID